MVTRRLGASDLRIGPIGLGGWQIGGPGGEFAWGLQDEALSARAIHAAFHAGIDWIDTAPSYGLGRSEVVIGRALAGRAERPLIFTKCGMVSDSEGRPCANYQPESLRRELADSLRRLRTDAVDLYQIHWPVPGADLETAWETLAAFKREGLVRAIGVSNFSVAELERLRPIAPVDSLQLPYSLLERRAEEELFGYCRANTIGVLAYSPLQSGLLSGTMTRERMAALPPDDWRHRDPQFQEPHFGEYVSVVDFLRGLATRKGARVAEVALAWVLRDPVVSGAIVGISRPDQVDRVIRAASLALDRNDLASIEAALEARLVSGRPAERFSPPPLAPTPPPPCP